MKQATIEKLCETGTRYTFADKCSIGGELIVDVSESIPNNANASSLPNLWKRNGFMDRVLDSFWSLTVFAFDADGNCYGMFNPQHEIGTNKLDFAWMLEATPENLTKLLDKVCELAYA